MRRAVLTSEEQHGAPGSDAAEKHWDDAEELRWAVRYWTTRIRFAKQGARRWEFKELLPNQKPLQSSGYLRLQGRCADFTRSVTSTAVPRKSQPTRINA